MRGTLCIAGAALVAALGCGNASVGADGAIARPDGSVVELDGGAPRGVALPAPTVLPIGAHDRVRVGPGLMLDEGSALAVDGAGAVTYAFESYGRARASAELWIGSSADGRHLALPRPQGFTDAPYEFSPSFAHGSLYFAAATDAASPPALYRAVVAAPMSLPAVDGVASIDAHPRFFEIPSGVALTFTDAAGRGMLAMGTDAATLGAPAVVSAAGSLPAVGAMADGTLALVYHDATNAYVRLSSDGATWSDPAPLSDMDGTHDVALAARSDGALDAYYARTALFRRALASDGSMGAEEQVSADELGALARPSAVLLPNGRVLVAFTEYVSADERTLSLASLPSEAAR